MPGIPANPAPPYFSRMGQPAPAPTHNAPPVLPGTKLHPLHTIEWVVDQVKATGCYPDVGRMTGRTTVLALRFLTEALANPHKEIAVRDHCDTAYSHRCLIEQIHEMCRALGLANVKSYPSRLIIIYTR